MSIRLLLLLLLLWSFLLLDMMFARVCEHLVCAPPRQVLVPVSFCLLVGWIGCNEKSGWIWHYLWWALFFWSNERNCSPNTMPPLSLKLEGSQLDIWVNFQGSQKGLWISSFFCERTLTKSAFSGAGYCPEGLPPSTGNTDLLMWSPTHNWRLAFVTLGPLATAQEADRRVTGATGGLQPRQRHHQRERHPGIGRASPGLSVGDVTSGVQSFCWQR